MTDPQLLVIANALGWALVHSIWQIALMALLLKVLLSVSSNQSARLRYTWSLIAMLGVFLGACFTFGYYYEPVVPVLEGNLLDSYGTVYTQTAISLELGASTSFWETWLFRLEQWLPQLCLAWLGGIFCYAIMMMQGFFQLRRLEKQSEAVSSHWQTHLAKLQAQLGINRKVRLLACKWVEEPITFRHFKPVILVPIGLLTGLSSEQVEVLLLHELAHIRRYDYLVNWLQSSLEALFFYHPAFWWISRQVRAEREHCCDDLVLKLNQAPMLYAQTLTQLQTNHCLIKTNLAMAATKNQGAFTTRIHRLFGKYHQPNRQKRGAILAVLLTIATIAVAFYEPVPLENQQIEQTADVLASDTLPPTSSEQEKRLQGLAEKEYNRLERIIEARAIEVDTAKRERLRKVFETAFSDEAKDNFEYHVDAVLNENGDWVLNDTTFLIQLEEEDMTLDLKFKKETEEDGVVGTTVVYVVDKAEQSERLQPIANIDLPNGQRDTFYAYIGEKEVASSPSELLKLKVNQEVIGTVNPEELREINLAENKLRNKKHNKKADGKAVQIEVEAQSEKEPPLFVLDGKVLERSKENMKKIDPDDIAEINVLKDEAALEKYGNAGKNGVIEIRTKKAEKEEPLIVVNGQIMGKSRDYLEDIDPNDIVRINVLKGEGAIEKYGKPGANGVVEIIAKTRGREKMLLVIDGKVIGKSKNPLDAVEPENFESFNVLTREAAVKKYGKEGANGVIEIITKKKANGGIYLSAVVLPEQQRVRFELDIESHSSGTWEIYSPTGKKIKTSPSDLLNKSTTKEGRISWEWSTKGLAVGNYTTVLKANGNKAKVKFRIEAEEDTANLVEEGDVQSSNLRTEAPRKNTFGTLDIYPNPASNQVTITFNVFESAPTELTILDSKGNVVESFAEKLFSKKRFEGNASFDWNVKDRPTGIYTAVLQVGDRRISKQIVVQ
ncbi:MAG: M56 family metallopeptidase [Bacteroidota bacterium]